MTTQVASLFPTRRLKHVVSLRRSRVDEDKGDRPYIGLENVESWTGKLLSKSTSNDENRSDVMAESASLGNRFEPGDVLFGKLRPYLAKSWVAGFPGWSSTEFLVMYPVEVEPRFLHYVCLWHDFVDVVDSSTFGAKMPRADWDFIGNISVPFPEWSKQCAIADYLDHETAQLDTLVEEEERLLALLAERRRTLITRAVTRGLDPDTSLRGSRIRWLPEIPAHWKSTRLKYVSKEPLKYGANEAALDDDPSFPRFVRITDIDENGNLIDETYRSLDPTIAEPYLLNDGDILFARSGATVGKTFLYKESWGPSCFAGYLIRLRCNKQIVRPDFVYAFTQSDPYWGQLREGMTQATIQNFSAERYGHLFLALPPLWEQSAIIEYLSNTLSDLDSLRSSLKGTTDLLKERRSALISAAVTGQLEVT